MSDGNFQNLSYGHHGEATGATLLFGNSASDISTLSEVFPKLGFRFLRQVHSAIAVRIMSGDAPGGGWKSDEDVRAMIAALPARFEADAHWTTERNVALCIRTADCVPVLLYSHVDNVIAAIHAGWRGVADEVIMNTFEDMAAAGYGAVNFSAWIGPHIGPKSFEVGADVGERLRESWAKALDRIEQKVKLKSFAEASGLLADLRNREVVLAHPDPSKARIDLEAIARAQLVSAGVPAARIKTFMSDTFADKSYHSFRRDRDKAGRQISFVALK